jgi:alkylhydroperoxidase/carboxymuconolactone decarboxylase family protein YurZ
MTTPSAHDFQLNRPGTLIAAIPAVLGFVPENSLVLVTFERGEMGAVLRVDLTEGLSDNLDGMAVAADAGRADAAVAVIVDDDGASCRMCNDEHRLLADALDRVLDDLGIELLATHVVDRVEAGGRWHSADGRGGPWTTGIVDDPMASPLAMAAVLDGRRLYMRRSELQDVVAVADPVRVAALHAVITAHVASTAEPRSDAEVREDVEHAMDAAANAVEGRTPSERDMARLANGLTDPRVRDTLYALAVGADAAAAESLWEVLSRSLPEPWRVEALVQLAFSAYARGDGPLAGVALETALRCDPDHRMAGMLDQALQSGMRPEQIRELAYTGYRLAQRLGVKLPPRRMFGSRAG